MLLAQWIDFAKAAVVLPPDAEGDRWRAAVPSIIELHASALALDRIVTLPRGERSVARDRASILISGAAVRLSNLWRGEALPDGLIQLREDAVMALQRAQWAGAVEARWRGPDVLVMPELAETSAVLEGGDQAGTFVVAPPGTLLMPGEPIAWWIDREAPALPAALGRCALVDVAVPHQVYRRIDDAGRAVEDVVVPMTEELQAGLPLLVALLERGVAVGRFPTDRATWEAIQRRAVGGTMVPVRWMDGGGARE